MIKPYNFFYLLLMASLVSMIIACGQETLSDQEIEATVQARVQDKMANMPTPTPNIEATVQARVLEEMQKNQDAAEAVVSNDTAEENGASPNIDETLSNDQSRDEDEIKPGDAEDQKEINECATNNDSTTGLCVDGEEGNIPAPKEQETCNTDADASTGYCVNGIAVKRENKNQEEDSLISGHNVFSSKSENKSNDDQSDKNTETINWIGPATPNVFFDYDLTGHRGAFGDYSNHANEELRFEDYTCETLGITILYRAAPWDAGGRARLGNNWNQPQIWGLANITMDSQGDSYLDCKADARIYKEYQIESSHPGYDKISFRVTKGCLASMEYFCGKSTGVTWRLQDPYIETSTGSGYVRQSETDSSY